MHHTAGLRSRRQRHTHAIILDSFPPSARRGREETQFQHHFRKFFHTPTVAPMMRALSLFALRTLSMSRPDLSSPRLWRTPLLLQPAWARLLLAAVLGGALVALWRWAVAI